jgi:hypothetical protein
MKKNDEYTTRGLADKLRDIYLSRRAEFVKQKKLHERYDKWEYWDELAGIVMDLDVSPNVYIDTAFLFCANPRILLPHMLKANKFQKEASNRKHQFVPAQTIREELNIHTMFVVNNNLKFKDYLMAPYYNVPWYIKFLLLKADKDLLKQEGKFIWESSIKSPHYKTALLDLDPTIEEAFEKLEQFLDGK